MEIKVLTKWSDLADDTELTMTKKELEDRLKGVSTNAVFKFTCDCADMAKANWCSEHVKMLDRLFSAVLEGKDYSDSVEDSNNED